MSFCHLNVLAVNFWLLIVPSCSLPLYRYNIYDVLRSVKSVVYILLPLLCAFAGWASELRSLTS